MKINILLSEEERKNYFAFLEKYLEDQEEICNKNKGILYFDQVLKYIKELKEIVKKEDVGQLTKFDRRAIKYVDLLESFRLTKYQYSKYSNRKRSFTEAVYSSIVLFILKEKNNFDAELKIMDAGCGTSRVGFELSSIYKNASVDLFDFSITNLFMAYKLIQSGDLVKIPYRVLRNFGEKRTYNDTKLMVIQGRKNKNVSFNIANLSKELHVEEEYYDIINASHTLNLMENPEQSIKELLSKLKKGGIIIISDLFGWKEDRDLQRRFFPDGSAFYDFFDKMRDIEIVEYWYGGPYCEEHNIERMDIYTNHMIVLKKL